MIVKSLARSSKCVAKIVEKCDHLLVQSSQTELYILVMHLCDLAKGFADNFSGIKGFGSSGCTCCLHLFFGEDPSDLGEFAKELRFERFVLGTE